MKDSGIVGERKERRSALSVRVAQGDFSERRDTN